MVVPEEERVMAALSLEAVQGQSRDNRETTEKCWNRFGVCCQRAQGIFSIQSKDAYKFLEVNPSSLSEAERNKQYKSIMEKLKKINPQGSARAAIAE